MIIHHYNSYLRGGAAIAARRLHDSLSQYGVSSRFYYRFRDNAEVDPSYREMTPPSPGPSLAGRIAHKLRKEFGPHRKLTRELDYFLRNRPEGFELFSQARLASPTPPDLSKEKPDVVHLHWISGFLDFPSFFAGIPDGTPVVWTLHDMNPFTGGCHYSWDCMNYREECGNCPQLNSHRAPDDLSHRTWRIKWDALSRAGLHVVADSLWLEKCSRESKLHSASKSFRTIHYGVDTELFRPGNKQACKQALSIDDGSFVICFGADYFDVRRKGLKVLMEALALLRNIRVTALIFGTGTAMPPAPGSNLRLLSLGHISAQSILSLVYSAADLFVIPSLQEAFGQTALEALACETAVVGFQVGGISDMIQPHETGLLAEPGNARDLADKIQWMHSHPEDRLRMGGAGRTLVQERFSLEIQARKYIDLYKELVKRA